MQIVFTTAFDEHALKAFEVQALDYLLKPVSPLRFEQAVERARSRVSGLQPQVSQARAILARVPPAATKIALDTGDRVVFVEPDEIDFAESARNYVVVHAGGTTYAIRSTLESFAAQLDPTRFSRINRSQLVNLEAVRSLSPGFTAIARCGSATASN